MESARWRQQDDDEDDDEEGEFVVEEKEDIVDDEDEDSEDEEDEDDDTKKAAASAVSSQPVSIIFKTNTGNALVDTSLELLVSRSHSVESVKQTLSRMLPGQPPVESLRLVYDGFVLQDDQLFDEVVDEEDDDDDEERIHHADTRHGATREPQVCYAAS